MELIEETFFPNESSALQRILLPGENSSIEDPSFDALLDEVCERLQHTKQKDSLKRIHKLEEILAVLEQELETFQKE